MMAYVILCSTMSVFTRCTVAYAIHCTAKRVLLGMQVDLSHPLRHHGGFHIESTVWYAVGVSTTKLVSKAAARMCVWNMFIGIIFLVRQIRVGAGYRTSNYHCYH